jgi:hypothetical protein
MSMLLVASLFLTSAAAQTGAPAPTSPDIVVEGEKKAKRQCQTIKISGSRMPRKICKSSDTASLLMPGVSDNVGTRGRAVSGVKGEPESAGMAE